MAKLSADRLATIDTIKKISDYPELNIYTMDVLYDYNLENLTPTDVHDTQTLMESVFREALPGIKVDYVAPNYGCSAFTLKDAFGKVQMGRNYDFAFDTSCMIVHCNPKDGYKSVSHAAIDNIKTNKPENSPEEMAACLTSPFIIIDGMNEKGVGIAVLTLDSKPISQNTGKPVLATTILIRLVLDKAASTQEAIELLKNYDMYAISGRDYHFYITDKTGDGCIVEFDCETPERKMVVTPTPYVTNFYIMYKEKVLPNQKNGIYGHGRERYDKIEKIFNDNSGIGDKNVAWDALIAASQLPNPENVTSNTQWSIVYNLTDLTYEFVLHRNWDDVYKFEL